MYNALYNKADVILSPTNKVFDEFEQYLNLDKNKFITLPNPVDIENIRMNAQEKCCKSNTKHGQIKFIACGRLEEQKGYDRLLKAIHQSDSFDTDWRLDIYGDGTQREKLAEQIVQYGFTEHVKLHGHTRNPYKEIAKADCLLMPSRFEGLPNVVLESLACGTPVIATKESGGIDEISKACHYKNIIIAEDMQSFIKHMKDVKPQNKEQIANALLADSYNKKNVIKAFEDIVDKCYGGEG